MKFLPLLLSICVILYSLNNGRYNNTPGTKWAKKYGEREHL